MAHKFFRTRTMLIAALGLILAAAHDPAAAAAASSSLESLSTLSLEELSNLEVTSVSKTAEAARGAPASVYVITHEDIMRSGVTSIPEALRLAPTLQVTQYSASRYVIGARGFAGAEDAQNFSNKLLILIDGRSVYSPLFSGVYMDAQDYLIEDIERIEVISGPGATLWGANAMHGVINIITRPAYLTQSGFARAGVGNQERSASARYGARFGESVSWRVYGKALERDSMARAQGGDAGDEWRKNQIGFRTDWSAGADAWTVQGDGYRARAGQLNVPDVEFDGANVLARFQRHDGERHWQAQAYYDYTHREEPAGGAAFRLRTYDIELQQRLPLGSRHNFIWGAGARRHSFELTSSASLLFSPESRDLTLANVFVQDTIRLNEALDLIVGLKYERDSYSGWNPLPDVRLRFDLDESTLLWASASRAIRSPTPFDVDVIERLGPVTFLVGNRSFEPEQVDAFEIGYRSQLTAALSLSVAAFYNVYDDLRTVEPASATVFLPLRWDNMMEGETYGLEAWAKWQATDWWRLAPGLRLLRKRLSFEPGASRLLGVAQSGNDPRSQAMLSSTMDLGARFTLDATLRYVDELPEPRLDAYYELNVALGWRALPQLDVLLSGLNLLDSNHLEYPPPAGARIRRSFLAEVRWRF